MAEVDKTNEFHIRLNSYDREALEFMKEYHGVSRSAAIRVSIRAAARQLGFKSKRFSTDHD